jgi:hypothetical protein
MQKGGRENLHVLDSYILFIIIIIKAIEGRAMPQAVSRRPVSAEARVRSRVIPCGICGGQSSTETGFPPSTSGFPCEFHSTGAPL